MKANPSPVQTRAYHALHQIITALYQAMPLRETKQFGGFGKAPSQAFKVERGSRCINKKLAPNIALLSEGSAPSGCSCRSFPPDRRFVKYLNIQ
jgi:hypothetical protein